MNSYNLDVNDLQDRIDTLYYATDNFIKRQPVSNISVKHDEVEKGKFTLSFGGGEISGEEIRIAKHTFTDMVSRLANIKDPLKNKLEDNNLNRQLAEDCINSSQYLEIVMDLNNAEKHGYPLKKTRRSKIDPRIENIRKEMLVPLKTGKFTSVFSESIVVFAADVVDLSGNKICDFYELIEHSLTDWEKFCITNLPNESCVIIAKRDKRKRQKEWQLNQSSRAKKVEKTISDSTNWYEIPGQQVQVGMVVKATGFQENAATLMGFLTEAPEVLATKDTIKIFDVIFGKQVNLGKKSNKWELLVVETQAELQLVHDYYWELFNPPDFS